MEAFFIRNTTVEFNGDGFLLRPELWNEDVAQCIARCVGIEDLGEKHWAVIHCIREHWEKHRTAPLIRNVCLNTGLHLDQLQALFPVGLAKGACKIAGLPQPDGCV